jgi:Holliday junction resolvase RusA-like endonuclease
MISFFIPAIPRGQARSRHAVIAGRSMAYKTKDQKMDEQSLQAQMMPHRPPVACSGAIKLRVTAIMPIPASKPKKWKMQAQEGGVHPTGRPDADNIAKNIIDCLVSMRFMDDDRQICRLEVSKEYGDIPGYHVMMEEF